jgi:hypothetical protein
MHGCWIGRLTVAAQELRPASRIRFDRPVGGEEGAPACHVEVEVVVCGEHVGVHVEPRDDGVLCLTAGLPDGPFHILCRREGPAHVGAVRQGEPGHPHGLVGRHEDHEVVLDAPRCVRETCVPQAVSCHERTGSRDRERRGAPEITGIFIADVEGLPAAVRHGIVVPRGEPVLVAVQGPGTPDAGLGDHAAEVRLVGHHIDPRGRRERVLVEDEHVLAGLGVEPSDPVVVLQRRPLWKIGLELGRCPPGDEAQGQVGSLGPLVELERQGPRVAVHDCAGDTDEQVEDIGVHVVGAPQDDAAGLVQEFQGMAGPHEDGEPVVQLRDLCSASIGEPGGPGGRAGCPPDARSSRAGSDGLPRCPAARAPRGAGRSRSGYAP